MLLLLMDKTNKNNLAEITYEESKDFYYFILKEYKGYERSKENYN